MVNMICPSSVQRVILSDVARRRPASVVDGFCVVILRVHVFLDYVWGSNQVIDWIRHDVLFPPVSYLW